MQDLTIDPTKTKIVACATMTEEIEPLLPQEMVNEEFDSGSYLIHNQS
jgi:hypothetical protein